MNVPYNNGKVQIGKYYQKPMYVEYDDDMLLLQTSLVGNVKAIRRNRLLNILYISLILPVVFGLLVFR
jgi:hypothetical protein